MLREALGGRRIAITGATGFLGTALVERLLRTVPDCELVLLVRPGRRGAAERIRREVLRNNCFDRLRAQLGARPVDDRAEQLLFRAEVVEDRLLADAELGGQGVERRGFVAARAECPQCAVEHPLGRGRHTRRAH